MKKCIAVLLTIALLMASLGCSFVVFAANSVSVDSFVESVEELNEEESEAEKTIEESVGSRVIVKALQKPSIYGDAEYFKGIYGKHILQYSTEEALEALKFHKSLSYVKWAETDSIIEAQGVSSYGDVLGLNLEYQWYGTNIADNRTGTSIEGANAETFNPDDFGADYDFYYCVIKSSDGDYHKTLVTGDRIRLDVNGDGVIDIADISLLLSMYGEAPVEPFQDFNGDGVIDVSEISLLLKSTVYGTKE